MRYISLTQATEYYELASRVRVFWQVLHHPALEQFARSVFELSRLSREEPDQTGWRAFLYPARRARNIVTTVPLPFNSPETGLPELMRQLDKLLPQLGVYAGEEAERLGRDIVRAGLELARSSESPLAQQIIELANRDSGGKTGLLLPLPEFTPAVKRHFAFKLRRARSTIQPVTWHDLVDASAFARLSIVGPLYWYRDHEFVLSSPRAPEITLLTWAWQPETPPDSKVLNGSRGGSALRLRPPRAMSADQTVDASDAPRIDWHAVGKELVAHDEEEPAELVSARVALLAANNAVLLPDEADRLVWVLDPRASPQHRVSRVDVLDLEPGDVLILRTSGGGDLVVPLADEILGVKSTELRGMQRTWKRKLREWVIEHGGLASAAAELKAKGCDRANKQNLQNWLDERSLRTEDEGDWAVIMDAASLQGQAARYWRAMGQLRSAHTKAGHSLGKRLLKMANTQPLDQLGASGSQKFDLGEGGSLSAFRIEGFGPGTLLCAPSRVLVPSPMRPEWLT